VRGGVRVRVRVGVRVRVRVRAFVTAPEFGKEDMVFSLLAKVSQNTLLCDIRLMSSLVEDFKGRC